MRRRWTAAVAVIGALAVLAACGSSGSSADSSKTPSTHATTTTKPATIATVVPPDPNRPYTVNVPPGYTAAKPAPLLIMLHGYGATGAIEDAYLKLHAATDAHGMLYVHPDGKVDTTGKQYWNATDACCDLGHTGVDDSTYIDAIIHATEAQYAVDKHRVYIVGHSNGGFMSYRMACDHADEIAGIVSLEAATFADVTKCKPSEAVSVLEVHGTGDQTINYEGAAIAGNNYPSAPVTAATWAKYDRCAATPVDPAPNPVDIEQNAVPATVTAYPGCARKTSVQLWTQPNGPHVPQWSATFDDQILAFLLAHPKA
jgi:polyhydroxybutyrate depolymerase